MQKITVTVLIITFLFISMQMVSAKDKKVSKTSEAEIKINAEIKEIPSKTQEIKEEILEVKETIPEAAPPAEAIEPEDARKKRQEAIKNAKEKLGRQEWVIYLTSLADRKSMGSDTLVFSDGKLTAKEFGSKGYQPSSCTITTQDDGVIVWETMQVNEKGDRIFWKGELNNTLNQGIMSMQSKDGKSQDISFSTTAPKIIEEKAEPKKEAPKKEEPRKKKEKGKK